MIHTFLVSYNGRYLGNVRACSLEQARIKAKAKFKKDGLSLNGDSPYPSA